MLTIAVIDDEPLARVRVKSLLCQESDLRIVGEAGTKRAAVELLTHEKPDVAIIDIQLPDGSGFDVVQTLPAASLPLLIFLTAYENYATTAFDVCALDYVVKPVRPERLLAAVDKARNAARVSTSPKACSQPARLAVTSEDGAIVLIPTSEIRYIEAAANYVRVHWRGGHQLYRESISTVEQKLDASKFARVHRSAIVNLDYVTRLEPNAFGDYRLLLDNDAELPLSRRYRDRIPLLLGRL